MHETANQLQVNLITFFSKINTGNKDEENSKIEDKFFSYKKNDKFESEFKKIFENPNTINQLQSKDLMFSKIDEKEEIKENDIEEDNINIVIPKLMGRKRKDSVTKGNHNKYSIDNIFRKIKGKLLHIIYGFINDNIKKEYAANPFYDIKKNVLKKIEQSQIVDSRIKVNQKFMKKNLKKIFSVEISKKYKCESNHNEIVINNLLDEKNEKKNMFNSLFNLTFLDCLNHFRGRKYIKELSGIMTFEEFKKKYEDDPDYIKSLDYVVLNYENIINNKKARKVNEEDEDDEEE